MKDKFICTKIVFFKINEGSENMRIISGIYKGKSITGFDIDGTRPTMDRLKESMFAMIQNHIKNSNCLDLFAGSGSLGLEAISNGAKSCYFVDSNKEIIKILEKNIMNIKEPCYLIKKEYQEALLYFKNNNIKFDLVFLDPPYRFDYINKSINKLLEHNILNDEAIIVCEYETEQFSYPDLEIIKERKYGTKTVRIYKYKES